MMSLEAQVVPVELALRLEELGVPQNSQYSWMRIEEHFVTRGKGRTPWKIDTHWKLLHEKVVADNREKGRNKTVCAFTVAELGEILKEYALKPDWNIRLQKWERELMRGAWISTDTEAEARGRMLAYLIENNLLAV